MLEAVFEEVEKWISLVQDTWQRQLNRPNVVWAFKRNIRFLLRLLKGHRYPRLAVSFSMKMSELPFESFCHD